MSFFKKYLWESDIEFILLKYVNKNNISVNFFTFDNYFIQ